MHAAELIGGAIIAGLGLGWWIAWLRDAGPDDWGG